MTFNEKLATIYQKVIVFKRANKDAPPSDKRGRLNMKLAWMLEDAHKTLCEIMPTYIAKYGYHSAVENDSFIHAETTIHWVWELFELLISAEIDDERAQMLVKNWIGEMNRKLRHRGGCSTSQLANAVKDESLEEMVRILETLEDLAW